MQHIPIPAKLARSCSVQISKPTAMVKVPIDDSGTCRPDAFLNFQITPGIRAVSRLCSPSQQRRTSHLYSDTAMSYLQTPPSEGSVPSRLATVAIPSAFHPRSEVYAATRFGEVLKPGRDGTTLQYALAECDGVCEFYSGPDTRRETRAGLSRSASTGADAERCDISRQGVEGDQSEWDRMRFDRFRGVQRGRGGSHQRAELECQGESALFHRDRWSSMLTPSPSRNSE